MFKSLLKSIQDAIGVDLYLEAKDIIAWRKMAYQVANCLERHQLFAACITGEATTNLYRDELYEFIHQLAHVLNIDQKLEEPRLWVVAGPVLNVSSITNRSVIVELYREHLLNLFYSNYRQPIHYRIGGWNEKKRTGRREVAVDVYIEKYHSLSAPVRQRRSENVELKTKPDLVGRLVSRFDSLISSDDILKIDKDDNLDRFLFLNSEEIYSLKTHIVEKYTKNIFKEGNEKELTFNFFKRLLEELDIQPRSYPEKVDKPNSAIF